MRLELKSAKMADAADRPSLHAVLQGTSASVYAPVLVAVAYYLGAEAAFYVGTLSDRIFAPFWPPNIILFCTLILVPWRRWWLFILAVFPAHVVAEVGVGMPVQQFMIAFATNCMVAMLSAFGVRVWAGGPPWFVTVRQAMIYLLISVVASPAVSALGGAFVQITGGGPPENYWTYWANWYSANALASATLGPVFLTWISAGERSLVLSDARKIEAIVLLLGLICACLVAFGAAPGAAPSGFFPTLLILPIPFVIWGAVRFGGAGASGTILIVTIIALGQSLQGSTVFNADSAEHNVLALQVFLIALSVPVLLLGAAIEELQRARNAMQDLAGTVLRTQDEERRRVSKELHEKIGQDLAAAHMVVGELEREAPPSSKPIISELDGALQRAMREIRAVSYLLYPPLLDEAGLALALKSYIGGLSKSSGVAVELALSSDLRRLPAEVEFVLFRVVQESVTEIHRHSGTRKARIELSFENTSEAEIVVLTIEDIDGGTSLGDGMPMRIAGPHEVVGLGLARMHERLRQIGGRLHVETAIGKTTVTATIPMVV